MCAVRCLAAFLAPINSERQWRGKQERDDPIIDGEGNRRGVVRSEESRREKIRRKKLKSEEMRREEKRKVGKSRYENIGAGRIREEEREEDNGNLR